MKESVLEMLECPGCHGQLDWEVDEFHNGHIEAGEARCKQCAAVYPVQDGIGIFLTPDLPRNDLWETSGSELGRFLRENPDVERKLMSAPASELEAVDLFIRGWVFEERGDFVRAEQEKELAWNGLYTAEYIACWNKQYDFVLDYLAKTEGTIVDLASGRGYLVQKIARQLNSPVIVTDFSPQVLLRNRRWLQHFGFDNNTSLLAFDARRTPFKQGSINLLTTNLGLPNIEKPESLLKELRRVVSGTFLAISHFLPEHDEANRAVLREVGCEAMSMRSTVLENFSMNNWKVTVENRCVGRACPTPKGEIFKGLQIDVVPVVDTELEWCVLVAE